MLFQITRKDFFYSLFFLSSFFIFFFELIYILYYYVNKIFLCTLILRININMLYYILIFLDMLNQKHFVRLTRPIDRKVSRQNFFDI